MPLNDIDSAKEARRTSLQDDAQVIEQVLAGDADCFEIIVKKYEKMIYNLAFTKLKNRETAQDITQDTFLRAYRMLAGYRTDSMFSTWIYRICQNLIFDYYRKEKKMKTVSLSYSEDEDSPQKEREIADETDEPLGKIIKKEKIDIIRQQIQSLPDDLREIIIYRDINEHSYNEIAEMLDLEIGTVKSRLNRAREKLKNLIKKNLEL